jgi:hypothetical protein
VNAPFGETVCAESTNDVDFFHQKLVPMPQEDKPPF